MALLWPKPGGAGLGAFSAEPVPASAPLPLNIALVDRQQFGSFVVDLRVRQTGREYGHRDLCFFFGFQDPAHFYYAHIASQTDDHAHNIFLVNGEARVKISTKTTAGHGWGERDWHQVRIRRDLESGSIQVFVNDMSKPIMSAPRQDVR